MTGIISCATYLGNAPLARLEGRRIVLESFSLEPTYLASR
jgi:hypothetical protein